MRFFLDVLPTEPELFKDGKGYEEAEEHEREIVVSLETHEEFQRTKGRHH